MANEAYRSAEKRSNLETQRGNVPSIVPVTYSRDPRIATGQMVGRQRGEQIYGQTQEETGGNVQDIIRMRRERLTGADPVSSRLRESRNRQIRMAIASGASPEELDQIRRSSEARIGQQEFMRSGQALSDYQRLVGNILKGQTGLELGFAGLEKASENVNIPPPTSSSGLGVTVICTELHMQGYMSDDIYKKDQAYGFWMSRMKPDVYLGYYFLATPVVRLMKKSKLFTRLVAIPGMAWARNMAGERNIAGYMISKYGEKFCGLIGRWLNGRIQISKAKA